MYAFLHFFPEGEANESCNLIILIHRAVRFFMFKTTVAVLCRVHDMSLETFNHNNLSDLREGEKKYIDQLFFGLG